MANLETFTAGPAVWYFHPGLICSGQVVVEAMVLPGSPVIVSENVGARDLVESGTNGRVIPPNDAGALYRVMARKRAGDPQKLRTMGKAARKTAERTGWSVPRSCCSDDLRVPTGICTGTYKRISAVLDLVFRIDPFSHRNSARRLGSPSLRSKTWKTVSVVLRPRL